MFTLLVSYVMMLALVALGKVLITAIHVLVNISMTQVLNGSSVLVKHVMMPVMSVMDSKQVIAMLVLLVIMITKGHV